MQRVLDRALHYLPQGDSLTRPKSDSRLRNAPLKFRVMLQPILEPILVRRKSDEDAGRTTVPRDHDFFVDRESQVL